jgi:glucokinase
MYNLGIDIGGTNLRAGIVDKNGTIIMRIDKKIDRDKNVEKIVFDIEILINSLLKQVNMSNNNLKSIGIGIPGTVKKNGLVNCINLGWDNIDFIGKLKEKMPLLDFNVENDATAAALGEAIFGSMKGKSISVMYTIGTGVGGGIIIDKKIYSGSHNRGSEIGHIVVGESFYKCNCGNNGCLETFCSATAIIEYVKKNIYEGHKTSIYDIVDGDLGKINAEMIFDEYRKNDDLSIEAVKRFIQFLSIGIAGVVNTLDPDIISIGGGVSRSSNVFLPALREEVKKHIMYKDEEICDIVCATLGSDAGIIGAAYL